MVLRGWLDATRKPRVVTRMLLCVVPASRKVWWPPLSTRADWRSTGAAPFVTVSEPWLLNLGFGALEGIGSLTELLFDVWGALVEPALLILVRRCLLEAFLLEGLRTGQLQVILLLFLVYDFWKIVVGYVMLDRA